MENICLKETITEPLRMFEPRTENISKHSTNTTSNQSGSEKETPTVEGVPPERIPVGRVYLITNLINGKRYVGITSRPLRLRWNEHVSNKIKYVSVLRRAITKYGKENFSITLLEEIIDVTEKELQSKESFYIDKYNTFIDDGQGYNLVKQSDSKLVVSEETRKKMSNNTEGEKNPFYGKHHNDEAKKKIGGAVVDYSGSKNPFFGKTHTEEIRKKKSEWNKKYQSGENHPRLGKTFTEASKEKMSLAQKGKRTKSSNSAFDHVTRLFRNIHTEEAFTGTQFDFRNKYGLKAPSVSSLCNKRIKSHKGWALA